MRFAIFTTRFPQRPIRISLIRATWNQNPVFQLAPAKGNRCAASVIGLTEGLVMSLLKWALIFFIISVIAAVFGFTGISAASADVARILFYIFVIIFIVLLVLALVVFRA